MHRYNIFYRKNCGWYGFILCGILFISISQISCKKFVQVDPPYTSLNAGNVYLNDNTAIAAMTGVYTKVVNSYLYNLTSLSLTSSSLYLSLSADELTLFNLNDPLLFPYYSNNLTPNTNNYLWSPSYDIIYSTNNIIQGLEASNSLTPTVKTQLLGEAKFMRAFACFYLVNAYGAIPLVLNTDWKVNSGLARATVQDTYQQIINDLKDAQSNLSSNYLNSNLVTTTEKTRPSKWVATALLSRVYLFTGDFANAEIQASSIINNSSLFQLNSINNVFLKNSNIEAIWQLQPTGSGTRANTGEGAMFILPVTGPNTTDYPVYLSLSIVNSFEPGDLRKSSWVDSVKPGAVAYYYPKKYKIGKVASPTAEYDMVMRLGEQYLIRAEARAQQNKIPEAQSDLNVIRNRAGLSSITPPDKNSILAAIMQERKVELFTEWGHRWFDLKRTGTINAVMSVLTSQKGGTWNANKALFPIPQAEINLDPQLSQNSGY